MSASSSLLSTTRPRPAPLYTEQFWTAGGAHFLLGMGFWMFVIFPLHLSELGASGTRMGVLLAFEPAAAVLVRPALGGLLSRRGRRWLLYGGGWLNLAAVALYLVVDDIGAGMAAVRVLHGIGIGALFTTFFTVAADLTPVERRTEGLAVFGISGMLPTSVAPLLGEELVLRFGFEALFVAAFLFSAASLALTFRLVEPADEESTAPRSFWTIGREPRLWSVWATAFLFSLGMASYVAFLAPFAREQGLPRVGVFFLLYSLSAVALRVFGRTLPDRIGPRRVLVPALGSLAVGLFLVSRLDSTATLAVAGLCCGLGHGYLFPILSGLAIEGADRNGRGSQMSFFTAVFDLGQVIGPIVFGLLADRVGYGWMFFVAMTGVAAPFAVWTARTVTAREAA